MNRPSFPNSATILAIALAALATANAETLTPAFDSQGRLTTVSPINKTDVANLAVGPISATDYFRTYLTFDLTNATTAIGEVSLILDSHNANENNTSSVPQVFTLFALGSDWDGSANPGPTGGTTLATINFTPSTGNDIANVTFASAALTTAFNHALGGELHLGIRSDAEGTDARSFKWFGSTEDGAAAPQLVYTREPGTLVPTGDSYIRATEGNQGSNNLVLVGDTDSNPDDYLRGALAFDLSKPELAGAIIHGATLTLTVQAADSGGSADEVVTIDLHELSSSFTNDGVTWLSRDGTNNWTTPGGDFGGVLASVDSNATTVSNNDRLDFSSPSLTAAAESALGGSLYLIAKLANEDDSTRNIFRFYSLRTSAPPILELDYTPASVLILNPTDDSFIREIQANQGSNGLALVGDTIDANDYLRSALAFDLDQPELVGATIHNAALTLSIGDKKDDTSPDQANVIDLHRLDSSFTNSGVTWFSRDGVSNWVTPGGDFGAPLVSLPANAGLVDAGTTFDFISPDLTNATTSAVGDSLYLIAKLATEDANRSIFRIASEDHPNPAKHPTLTIRYTAGAGNDFSNWISSAEFGLDPEDQDFADDPDGDGQANGVEAFFGTNPGVSSAGLTGISKSGNTVSFQHPNPDTVLSDVTGGYEWSLDLVTWYADDGVDGDGNTTLTTVATPDSPSDKITTVVATIDGPVPSKTFLRAVAVQTF